MFVNRKTSCDQQYSETSSRRFIERVQARRLAGVRTCTTFIALNRALGDSRPQGVHCFEQSNMHY